MTENEYGAYKGSYPWFSDYPGSQLVEPYKETTITLTGPAVHSGNYNFLWTIEGEDGEVHSGAKEVVKFTKAGLFKIEVHVFDSSDNYMYTYQTTLISK